MGAATRRDESEMGESMAELIKNNRSVVSHSHPFFSHGNPRVFHGSRISTAPHTATRDVQSHASSTRSTARSLQLASSSQHTSDTASSQDVSRDHPHASSTRSTAQSLQLDRSSQHTSDTASSQDVSRYHSLNPVLHRQINIQSEHNTPDPTMLTSQPQFLASLAQDLRIMSDRPDDSHGTNGTPSVSTVTVQPMMEPQSSVQRREYRINHLVPVLQRTEPN
ncbi:hypothetical protein ADUPG1_012140 [Aduncisulcus paluster]|uniref:Uncharacterized protein n=1 Tax=Aduncisulcus paluster TaxID=2918883 RepID=A0ABQ5JYH8_9EUKA|nr:hypothetical protein ADUPG1_012140 [Aduncisulcus paluster]